MIDVKSDTSSVLEIICFNTFLTAEFYLLQGNTQNKTNTDTETEITTYLPKSHEYQCTFIIWKLTFASKQDRVVLATLWYILSDPKVFVTQVNNIL